MTTPHPALLDANRAVDRAVRDAYFAGFEVGKAQATDEMLDALNGAFVRAAPVAEVLAAAARNYCKALPPSRAASFWTLADWAVVLRHQNREGVKFDHHDVVAAIKLLRAGR